MCVCVCVCCNPANYATKMRFYSVLDLFIVIFPVRMISAWNIDLIYVEKLLLSRMYGRVQEAD